MSTQLKHNGANTNLYCDGRLFFVHGCPACDKMYEATMKPRWKQAASLAEQLKTVGMVVDGYHADLWKIWVDVEFEGKNLRVQDVQQ